MKIIGIYLSRLRNNEYFQFLTEFIQLVNGAIISRASAANISEAINSLLNLLKELMDKLDQALMYLSTSELTIPVADADENRDMTYRGFVLYVQAFTHSLDEEKREAARRIQVLIDNYGDFRKRPYNDQTAVMDNFFQDLQEMHSDHIATIGAEGFLNEMKDANDTFKGLMDERHEERVTQMKEEVRQLRSQIDDVYRQTCSMIESGNLISGGTMYTELIKRINERITYYKTTLATRQGVAEANKKKEEEKKGKR